MTASEQHLHPASLLFDIARYAKVFAWPALLAYMGASRGSMGSGRWGFDASSIEPWLWLLLIPSTGLSIVRYLTFRVRYEPDALVIRSGLVFRNVRRVPYARIQNLDAVQNVFHRIFGVADVRVETGGGSEVEARMSVLPVAVVDEMRRRVFVGRNLPHAEAAAAAATPSVTTEPAPLVRLSPRELLLFGFLENKGMVLVGAAYGALWETGFADAVMSTLFAGTVDGRGLLRDLAAFLIGRGPLPVERLAFALGGLLVFLVFVRLLSMAWAVVRLYGFTVVREGEDLRVTYGLLTRVTATIPLRRIQKVTVHRGWLQRKLGRAGVRVETAGGQAGAATNDREWVAPLIHEEQVDTLLADIVPHAGIPDTAWQGLHPRAFRRAVKPALAVVSLPCALLLGWLHWRALLLVAPLIVWTVLVTRQHVRHRAWAHTGDTIAMRSGWLSRTEARVRVSRVQAITLSESPFDRRATMARLRVDTAGARDLSPGVDIPYLDVTVARSLERSLAEGASRTAFSW